MNRMLIGAALGVVCAISILAGLGAWDGWNHGIATNGMPPGFEAASLSAIIYVVFFWPVPSICAAIIGGLAGFGSWLVRPKEELALQSPARFCD